MPPLLQQLENLDVRIKNNNKKSHSLKKKFAGMQFGYSDGIEISGQIGLF